MTPARFPVLWQGDQALFVRLKELRCPRSVSWSFVAPHEVQAQWNHAQTLRRLAERGGLSPAEMVAVVTGCHLRDLGNLRTDEAAVPRLLELLERHEAP